MNAKTSGAFPRGYWPWLLLLLLAVHAGIVIWAAMKALAVERQDYMPGDFAIVALATLAFTFLALAFFGRHTRAFAVFGSVLAAAVVLTPGAVIVVLLCLLSAHVLGTRLVRWVRMPGDPGAALPWTVTTLVGVSVWIGLVCITAAMKIHYAPIYTTLLLVPLAFAWRDVADTMRRLRALAAPAPDAYSATERGWVALGKVLPAWLLARLEVFRPVLAVLDTQIATLSAELEKAAPPDLPGGLGKLTIVTLSREISD